MMMRYQSLRALFIVLLVTCSNVSTASNELPVAINGELDLSTWDFDKDGVIKLDGQWAFYWQQLLSPEDFYHPENITITDTFSIPGRWDGRVIEGIEQTGDGYATFRLRVKVMPETRFLAIRIKEESSAYRLWINGKEVASNGVVGDSRERMVAQYLLQLKPFVVDSDSLEFVLQVSNFHHRKGGVWFPIELGTFSDIQNRQYLAWAVDLFLFGSLLVMGIYYLFIFVLRKKEYSAIYFSVFCLLIAVRTVFTNTRFFVYLFPDFPWEAVYKIELLTVTLTFPVMLMFIHSLYPNECSKYVVRAVQIIGALSSIFVILVDARLSSHIVVPYQLLIVFLYLFITYVQVRAVLRKRSGAGIILIGMTLLYASIINDVLASQAIISTPFLASIGMLLLALSQSFGLARNFVAAFNSVERLSSELEQKNIQLTLKDKLKDEFLANTSHELRTPLHGMIGIAESLLASTKDNAVGGTRKSLELIVDSGLRLSHLVNEILDFLRLKHKDFTLQRQSLDLYKVVDSVIMLTDQLAKSRSLKLINKLSANLPPVFGDQNRLQQILYNLIGNAIKYTEQGQVQVTAHLQGKDVIVSVTDTGIGIAADRLQAIFQPFEQADNSSARQRESSGLGLGICRQLVELHGGRLTVESTPGKGSCFSFNIPCASGSIERPESSEQIPVSHTPWAEPAIQILPVEQQTQGGSNAPRILAIDDDPVNLQVVINHLSAEGMTVVTAADGEQALQRLQKGECFDLVLLDIMMPGINGFKVCQQIRLQHTSADLPVLMLTAKNELQDLVQGLECGANDYLSKPFMRRELLARVHAQLKVRLAHKALAENQRLKQEIERRRQIEYDLRQTQYRLGAILNSVPEAILVVNENTEISFLNQAFEKMTGYRSGALLGKSTDLLFNMDDKAHQLEVWLAQLDDDEELQHQCLTLTYPDHKPHIHQVQPKRLELDDEQLLVLIVQSVMDAETLSRKPLALALIESLNQNRNRLHHLKQLLGNLTPQLASYQPEIIHDINSLDGVLAQLSHGLSSEDTALDLHQTIVEVMRLTLDYWQECTQSNKAELARQSGLWKVYTNEDGWDRTQTMDRYLSLETLPKRPRRKQVVRTAEFALTHCGEDTSLARQLEKALAQLHQFAVE